METSLFRITRNVGVKIASAAALVSFIFIYIDAGSFGSDARRFPRVLAVIGCVCAAVILFQSFVHKKNSNDDQTNQEGSLNRVDILTSYIGPVLYAIGLYFLGFWVASFLCLIGLLVVLGERRVSLIAAVTIGTLLSIYLVFEVGFSIRMPEGLLFEMLRA